MPKATNLRTRVSLTQVMTLLERLTGRRVSRSLIKYYGQKDKPLVVARKKNPKNPGNGRGNGGNTCTYSVTDVVLLRWLIELTAKGLEVRKFYKAIAWLRVHIPDALSDPTVVFFLTDNENADLCMSCREGKPIQLTGKPGQILLALAGSSVEETVKETAEMLSA